MQAIITKFIPCTNFKPSRIKASCERGSLMLSWNHGGDVEKNHVQAAQMLVNKFMDEDANDENKRYRTEPAKNPWNNPRAHGQLKSGEFVHAFICGLEAKTN